ncbi:hypothetical protein BDZ91DRAFT_759930 [Kalaharituber pfeilii]|nr:hypothetical protein BDZ91DRAFT_759930 [Kalaharituber pfeilii]
MSFVTNLLLFSPLLIIAFVVLAVLDRLDASRASRSPPETGNGIAEEEWVPLGSDAGGGAGDSKAGGNGESSQNEEREGEAESEFEVIRRPVSHSPTVEDADEEEEEYGDDEDEYELITPPGPRSRSRSDSDPSAAGPSTGAGATNPHQPSSGDAPQPQNQAPTPPHRPPRTRTVGTKKAASLARRDQRRAYNEFIRSQALAAAEAARAVEEELQEKQFEEKRRRALAEEEIDARREKERLQRLEREREEERRWREDVEAIKREVMSGAGGAGRGRRAWNIKRDLVPLVKGRNDRWVVETLEREGLVGTREGDGGGGGNGDIGEWEMGMVTGKGWYVIVGKRDIEKVYEGLEEAGGQGMSWGELGRMLQEVLGMGTEEGG